MADPIPGSSPEKVAGGEVEAAGRTLWAKCRRLLRLGPTRRELVADGQLWRARCQRKNADVHEAHIRMEERKRANLMKEQLEQAEKRERAALAQVVDLENQVRAIEPKRVKARTCTRRTNARCARAAQ